MAVKTYCRRAQPETSVFSRIRHPGLQYNEVALPPGGLLPHPFWYVHSIILAVYLLAFFIFASGMQFSTKDNDNDVYAGGNCAQDTKGAWWYRACHYSNLNGLYLRGPHASYANGVNWGDPFRGHYYSLKRTEMKVKTKVWAQIFSVATKLSAISVFIGLGKHTCSGNHWPVTWRHTGSDESTTVYLGDAPSLLHLLIVSWDIHCLSGSFTYSFVSQHRSESYVAPRYSPHQLRCVLVDSLSI